MSELKIKTGKDIPAEDNLLLTLIVNSAWKELIETDQEMMGKRLNSGNLFLAAYDLATDDDLIYGVEKGIFPPTTTPIPVGLLETIAIKTHGFYENVPKDYFSLTQNGLWQEVPKDADTLIMVDVTGLPTRTGKKSKGEVKTIITHAKNLLSELPYRHVWTFTPDIEAVRKWHESMGAIDTQYKIPCARPGWKVPAVNLMDYSHLIKKDDILR
ncbi:hypothetical protein HYX13_00255 [Candidatus Woesearchaeota archaeon]|nr:hypothetical protein [Candidatus Woesearchaeota archaeon]